MFSAAFRCATWVRNRLSRYCQRQAELAYLNPACLHLQPRITHNSAFAPIMLTLVVFSVYGCSSGSLLSIVDSTNERVETTEGTAYSKSTFGLYEVSTFDVYADDNIIHVIAGGKMSAGHKQIRLHYLRSEDSGKHWSAPVAVANLPASINVRGNDIQLAAKANHLLAVWQGKGELPGMGPMVSAYSNDSGQSWKQGANPAVNNAGDQSHIDLIADKHGHFYAVWLEDPEENGYQSLRYARSVDNGKHWETAATLDDSTCSCCWNTFALSPQNELNILYRDMKPRDMSLVQSYDDGLTWQHISTVGEFGWQFDGCPHDGGGLTYVGTDNRKQLHSLVWTGAENKSGLYHLVSNDNGAHWSAPKKLGNTAIHGDIAAFDGNIFAIWDEMGPDGSSIFYAKSGDGGTNWSDAQRLSASNYSATHPRLATTEDGVIALWTEKASKQPGQLAWRLLD